MKYVNLVWGYIKSHWITVLALGMVLWTVDKPYVMAYVAAHPFASVIYANVAAVVSFYIKSPFSPTQPPTKENK